MDKEEIYKAAIDKYGAEDQVEMIIEECSELIHAIQKMKRDNSLDNVFHVCEEIADVEIMIEQARAMFDFDIIDQYKTEKLERLEQRLKD